MGSSDLDERLKQADIELKAAELREKQRALWTSPLVVSVIAASLGLLANLVNGVLQAKWNRDLERQRSEAALILKAAETGDLTRAKQNLLFFVDAKFISDPDSSIRKLAARGAVPLLPVGEVANVSGIAHYSRVPDRVIDTLIITESWASVAADTNYMKDSLTLASYHWLVGPDGRIYRLVNEEDVAFGAAQHNRRAIIVATAQDSVMAPSARHRYPAAQQEALGRLLADIVCRRSVPVRNIVTKQMISPGKISVLTPRIDSVRTAIGALVTGRC